MDIINFNTKKINKKKNKCGFGFFLVKRINYNTQKDN